MKRTQLYLEEDLWNALHAKALLEGSTISELVRIAVRERYMGNRQQRRAAMMAIVGLWKDLEDLEESGTMIRRLRHDSRRERLETE